MSLRGIFSKAIISPVFWVIFALFGLFAHSTPVSALPTPDSVLSTSVSTHDYSTYAITSESTNLDNLIASEDAGSVTDSGSSSNSEGLSCFEQIGPIGWLVCPTTGVLTKAIDGIYEFIEQFLVVEPLSTDHSSPIYIVWEYARNITNIVFIIFILVIVYSQVTGLGISNYGVKKTLPRMIIAAILVNLSFIICSVAIDVSNVVGVSLRGLFQSVEEMAIASGAINPSAQVSWADLFAAISAGGVIAGLGIAAALASAGGTVALLLTLLPLVLGALVSVVIGLATVSLRQAVISILVMISPLAFVAYLLPNTEPLYKRWFKLLQQMLVFYPMFSLLYGASHLAGWVLISSAKSIFGVLLGMAVQILPLFFSISLLKMSNTLLGKVSSALTRASERPLSALRGVTAERAALRRSRYLAEQPRNYQLARRAAQKLQDSRTRVQEDTAKYTATARQRGLSYSASSIYDRNGKLTRRGESLYNLQTQNLQYQRAINKAANDFDEGMDPEAVARNNRQKQRLEAANQEMVASFQDLQFEQGRALNIKLENLKNYEEEVNKAVQANNLRALGKKYDAKDAARFDRMQNVMSSNNALRNTPQAQESVKGGLNTIVANAIASKARVRTEITGDYFSLFNEASYTANINDYLGNALSDIGRNENAAAAAIQVMMLRGDTDLIAEGLLKGTPNFVDPDPEHKDPRNLTMQKRLSDTLIGYKNDSAILWGYAKCLNMARGKAEARRRKNDLIRQRDDLSEAEKQAMLKPEMPDYFTFEEYLAKDGPAAKYGLDAETMIASIADGGIAAAQDRTVWAFAKEQDRLLFTTKQRRAGLFSMPQEGEKLDSLIDVHLGGNSTWDYADASGQEVSNKTTRQVLTFKGLSALEKARENITDLIKDNSAAQMCNFKTNTITAFGAVMSNDYRIEHDRDGNQLFVFDLRDADQRNKIILDGLEVMKDSFQPNIAHDLSERAKRGQLDQMNPNIRKMLNQVLHFENQPLDS